VSGKLHAAADLLPVPIIRRLGGPQRRSGGFGKKEKCISLPGNRIAVLPVLSLVSALNTVGTAVFKHWPVW
jgi:hypothetical protein